MADKVGLTLNELYESKAALSVEITHLQHKVQDLAMQRAKINRLIAEKLDAKSQ